MSQPLPPPPSMIGKTCLVTGGTSGIGAVAAEALAAAGARVLVVGRDPARTDEAVARMRSASGADRVEGLLADLSSMAEVRRLAAAVRDRADRLDVLLNNAGAMYPDRRETVDGLERTWALNHLAPFLLTNLLLEPLAAAAPARVVTVASEAHRMAPGIDFDDPNALRRYGMLRAYARSKLANILFSKELARRLEGRGVTSNALHPGFVRTSFFREKGWAGRLMATAAALGGVPATVGARTSIFLATAPEVAGATGGYYVRCRPATPSKAARDDEAAARLWRLSAETTGLEPR